MNKICNTSGCNNRGSRHGYCKDHFLRLVQQGRKDLLPESCFKPCTVSGCEGYVFKLAICEKHYKRLKRTGTTDDPDVYDNSGICRADGCGKQAKTKGLCSKHYYRLTRKGDFNAEVKTRHYLYGTTEYWRWHNATHTLPKKNGFEPYTPWVDNFEQFLADMGKAPKGRWLCRKDPKEGYCPENLYWGTPKQAMLSRQK